MADHVNLIKLCVGAEVVEDLTAWQAQRMAETGRDNPVHVTRMWPKRGEEILRGGSLFWVFKGVVLARQRIVALEERIGGDGIRRCGLVLDPQVIRTEAASRRPFQGWRYLPVDESPRDLPARREGDDDLPPELQSALSDLGLR